jgi:predicted oxidoreductase
VLSDGVSVVSWGGVAVDGELRVIDEAGRPIPGLSAAGEVLGASATMGDAFCSGMAVTPAMSLGRWLGRRLAADTKAVAAAAGAPAAV